MQREKAAIYQPWQDSWDKAFSDNPKKEQT